MPSNTTYYNLFIFDPTTDTGSTFLTFRSDIAGTSGSSNFMIIDAALHTHDTQIAALQNFRGVLFVPLLFQSANYFTATGVTGISSYSDGMILDLSLDQDCTGTVTININTLGTKSLLKYNSTGSGTINLDAGDMKKNKEYLFRYSVSAGAFLWVSPQAGDQINVTGGATGNLVTLSSTGTLVGTTTQSGFISSITHAATGKTTPIDADEIGILDSAASFVLKVLTWANLKATLKTYFDSLTTTLTNKTFSDSTTIIGYVSDLTKAIKFSLGGATANKTMTVTSSHTDNRTITLPDATDTLVGLSTVDSLANKRIYRKYGASPNPSSVAIDCALYDLFYIYSLAQACTISVSSTPSIGQMIEVWVTDNGVGRGLTWTSMVNRGAYLPSTTVAAKWTRVLIQWDGTFWSCIAVAQEV